MALDFAPSPSPSPSPLLRALTRSECEVVECVRREMVEREIAAYLGVTVGTVRVHVHHVSEALPRRGQLRGYFRVWVYAHRGV